MAAAASPQPPPSTRCTSRSRPPLSRGQARAASSAHSCECSSGRSSDHVCECRNPQPDRTPPDEQPSQQRQLGNRSLQSGGAPPAAPQGTPDPAFDVNNTGRYHNKTVAFQTIEKSYLDYHPTRAAILGSPMTGYALIGPQVSAPTDPRSNGTLQLYFAQQWGANSIYIQTDDRSYRDIRLAKLAGNRAIDDVGSRADNPERTMLGATQLQWLETTLLQAQQDRIPWKFVAISSPIDQVGGASVQDGTSWWGG